MKSARKLHEGSQRTVTKHIHDCMVVIKIKGGGFTGYLWKAIDATSYFNRGYEDASL